MDRVWWIGNDSFKGFVIPVSRMGEGIPMGNVKFVIANIMEKHIDTAEVVCSNIDFLPEEALPYIFPADEFPRLQKKGAGTTGGVIDFIDFLLVTDGNAGQKL